MLSLVGAMQQVYAKIAGYKVLHFCIFILPSLFFLPSCSSLPQGVQIPDDEAQPVKAAFQDLIASHQNCPRCFDARAALSVKSIWFKGSMGGYLKTCAPDRLKYVALNPLGQTLAILVMDGGGFHLLSLPARKSYKGRLEIGGSAGDYPFSEYIPAGFPFDRSFYLLTGFLFPRLPGIEEVEKAKDGTGYWLKGEDDTGGRSLILFDYGQKRIRQYVLLDDMGRESLRIAYENHEAATGCNLPGLLHITSPERGAAIRLRLSDWRRTSCSSDDFYYPTPGSFSEVLYH